MAEYRSDYLWPKSRPKPILPLPEGAPLGRRLRHWRKTSGRTIVDAAVAIGVSPPHLTKLEIGRCFPKPELRARIESLLEDPK